MAPEEAVIAWAVTINVVGGPTEADDVVHLLDRLGRSAVATADGPTLVLTFDVHGRDAAEASRTALGLVRQLVPGSRPVEVHVSTVEAQEAALERPDVPPLLGIAELAGHLGVSRQRAWTITREVGFPAPVAELRAGPVWTKTAVDAYLARRGRGRRRPRQTAEAVS